MNRLLYFLIILIITSFVIPVSAQVQKPILKTKTFKTDFISFNLSDQWECKMDGTEYVCRPTDKIKKSDAIIIVAAKIPGAEDNVKAYYTYLKEPKKMTDYRGQTFTSQVSLIKYKDIEATQWVDAIHLSSEVKDFYTRYLATVKNGIAILVTYSVSKSKNALYAAELNKMASSIKVLAKAPQLGGPPKPPEKKEMPHPPPTPPIKGGEKVAEGLI